MRYYEILYIVNPNLERKKIDETKIIKFENLFTESTNGGISLAWMDEETGHPSEKGCRYISEVIFKRLSEG